MESDKEADKINVVIVDDEYLERNLLKNCLDWASLQIEIVGEAENASEALEVIQREKPDVLFTDIQMPGIDGIGLSELILKQYPEMKVVVITGFDKFDYAQRSIKAGVSDYLLKPIDSEDVRNTAVKIKKDIEVDRKNRQDEQELRKQLYDSLPYLRERFFNELMVGAEHNTYEKMSFLGIHFENAPFQVAVFEIISEQGQMNEESRFLLSMRLRREIESFFPFNTFVSAHTADRIVVLNNDLRIDLYEKCECLLQEITKTHSCPLSVGLGSIKKSVEEISVSYQEALKAVNYRVVLGNNVVILYDNIFLSDKTEPPVNEKMEEQLDFYLRTGLDNKVRDTIRKMCESIEFKDTAALKTLRTTAINIVLLIFRAMAEVGVDPDELYRYEAQINNRIFQLETLPETESFLEETSKKCLVLIDRHQSIRINSLIEDVKNYVRENFADSGCSLADIADKLYFNQSYLSRTFKKKAGISFTEFLTEVRMEKTVELLREGKLKAFEIAEAVGIPDPNYFSTCFKKYTGVSVSQYRKSMNIRAL